MRHFLHITPRALGILAILFISSFALDSFEEGLFTLKTFLGFSIHLAPSIILTLLLWFAWTHEKWGGVLFVCASLPFFILLSNPFQINLFLGGPFILVGVLFLLEHFLVRRTPQAEIS